MTDFIHEPERKIPVRHDHEVVVLGGGPAGIAAAAAPAGVGPRTLLTAHSRPLGGLAAAGGGTNFCGRCANVHGEIRPGVRGVADEFLKRMARLGGLNASHGTFGKTK